MWGVNVEGGACMVYISNGVSLLYVHVCTCVQACECLRKPEEDDSCLTLLLPVYFCDRVCLGT